MLTHLPSVFLRLADSRCGVTAIEYALVAGLISVAIIAAVTSIGQRFQSALDAVASAMN